LSNPPLSDYKGHADSDHFQGVRRVGQELTTDEQDALLSIARNAIETFVRSGENYIEPREERNLNRRNGCFVTIYKDDELRGCIGNFQSELPLFKEVSEMAVASATRDPRFYPMKKEDLDAYRLEISVLTPLHKIEDIAEIEVGTHGIYLEKGYYRGVLLPQVATEYGWDRETFLKQTCIKAGLPTDAWKSEDAEIYIFSAQVFGESEA